MRLAVLIAAASFVWYGASLFVSASAKTDFERYGLARVRWLVGSLQIAASLGLLLGMSYRPLIIGSSAGLALMMLVAIAARLRVGDRALAAIPAFLFLCLNLIIFIVSLVP